MLGVGRWGGNQGTHALCGFSEAGRNREWLHARTLLQACKVATVKDFGREIFDSVCFDLFSINLVSCFSIPSKVPCASIGFRSAREAGRIHNLYLQFLSCMRYTTIIMPDLAFGIPFTALEICFPRRTLSANFPPTSNAVNLATIDTLLTAWS